MLVRIINTICILLMIDLLGLLPESALIKLVIDVLVLGSTFYIVVRKKKPFTQVERFLALLFLFFTAVAFITFLRGGSTLVDIYKFYRIYFPLLIVFPLIYDMNYTEDGFRYYRKMFQVLAICVSVMLILISVFHLEIFSSWPGLAYGYQEGEYIPGLMRVYMHSSFTLPIVEFILLVYALFIKSKVNKFVFALISIGFLLQGFRSYILATILIMGLSIFSYLSKQKGFSVMRVLKKNFFVLLLAFSIGSLFLGSRIASGVSDFVHVSGTFGARVMTDAFRIKVFLDNPVLGVGFLHNDAARARKMGVTSSEDLRSASGATYDSQIERNMYSLRSTDSGYLDLLIQFGLVGVIVFLWLYLSFYFRMGKQLKVDGHADLKIYVLTLRAVLLLLLVTLITHSGMTSVYGLLPLAIVLSFAQYQIARAGKEPATATPFSGRLICAVE